jgi:hypothetical protein
LIKMVTSFILVREGGEEGEGREEGIVCGGRGGGREGEGKEGGRRVEGGREGGG